MKRLMFFALLALLFTGCSSSTGGGSGAASSPNEVASIDLRIQVPDRQPRQGELALLIIRVVDADNLDLDVVSPIRVDLTGLTGSTVTQRVPGVAPGRRRVLVQALNAEGGLELAGDSGVVLLSPTEVRPVRIDLNPPAVRRLSFVNQPSSALVNTVLAPPRAGRDSGCAGAAPHE